MNSEDFMPFIFAFMGFAFMGFVMIMLVVTAPPKEDPSELQCEMVGRVTICSEVCGE